MGLGLSLSVYMCVCIYICANVYAHAALKNFMLMTVEISIYALLAGPKNRICIIFALLARLLFAPRMQWLALFMSQTDAG